MRRLHFPPGAARTANAEEYRATDEARDARRRSVAVAIAIANGDAMSDQKEYAALREGLAEYAHDAWAGWMKYLFEKGEFRTVNKEDGTPTKIWVMPDWAADRWTRQMLTPYADLPESEKESDRLEADRMIEIMDRTPTVTPTPESN